ncbi:MAG: SPASM domain-containing protein [Magnetococcales bacterium]|nr:SPASM domain-containing protein [Magnetococcales bacterium]
MGLMDFALATKGADKASRLTIIGRHVSAVVRHMTFKKAMNLFRVELARFRGAEVVGGRPYILKIESTNVCNLKCAYCYDNRRQPEEGERAYGRMSFADFQKIFDEVGEYLFKINLYGFGEPFLFPETYEMIRYATDHNVGMGVSSNLNLKDEDAPRKIVESGLEVLIFSCHGVSQEAYSQFMVKGDRDLAFSTLAKVMEEKKRLGSNTPVIDWQYCVTSFNQKEIPLAKEKARELGVDVRFIQPFLPEGARAEWYPKGQSPKPPPPRMGCSWPYRSAYINYDGGLLPCCKDTRFLKNDFGNVISEGFAAVWNNDDYQSSRRLIKSPGDTSIECDTMCLECPVVKPFRDKPNA